MAAGSAGPLRYLLEAEEAAGEARSELAARCKELGTELLPILDMEFVASLLIGATVDPVPDLSRDGERLAALLDWKPPHPPKIYVEQYDPPFRQRFSICHELGHYYLHARHNVSCSHCVPDRVDSDEPFTESEDPSLERDADAFAGAFLLPADLLESDLARFGRCVAFLAERYGVSESAVRRRLNTLEMIRNEDRPHL